jgi:hypothetical protein
MTALFSRTRARRAAAAVGAVTLGLVALSACEKPTPMATVTVGSTVVTTEAACYNDGNAIPTSKLAECLKKDGGKTVKASMDDRIRFGVDPKVADGGWTLFINGQPAEAQPNKKTYRTIAASQFFQSSQGQVADQVQISVVQAKTGAALGVWQFKLERQD